MTDADRQRLAAILGMLGSDQLGERAAAALKAEAFRKKHGLTWEELIAIPAPTEVVPEQPPSPQPPPVPPKPEPFVYAPWTPPELTPAPPAPNWAESRWLHVTWMGVAIGAILILLHQLLGT